MPNSKETFKEAIETALPSTDEEDDRDDYDTCSPTELDLLFQTKCHIRDELAVTLQKEYVLSLCCDRGFTRLVTGLSNGEVWMFDITGERNLNRADMECIPKSDHGSKQKTPNICGVQFLDDTKADCLLIGSTDGLVRLYDLRAQKVQRCFKQESGRRKGRAKIITCFSRNSNGRILCTGTEREDDEVYVVFYDIRMQEELGAYSDSHDDDITSVRFHPQNPDLLCSGSLDGLINIFDIKKSTEMDALLTTINTESSVEKLNWHKNVYEKDIISCISHTNFKAYECEEGDLIVELDREKITSVMQRKDPSNCNLINAHNMDDDGVLLLAGNNSKNGEVLRGLRLENKQLKPMADFDGNKQIIRDSVFNSKSGALITAGERGFVTLWTPESYGQEGQLMSLSNKLKSKSKHKSIKNNPY